MIKMQNQGNAIKNWRKGVEFSTIKPILLKSIEKMEIGFISLYQIGVLKNYSLEKVRLLGMGEGIPLKKDRNR